MNPAAPLMSKDDCYSCRADLAVGGPFASVMLNAPRAIAGPRQSDRCQRQNKRFAAYAASNHLSPRRPAPHAADKSP
jgi:hypothetical protein